MNIAIVHDFLSYWGGAERVLKGMIKLFPHAPVYTLWYDKAFVDRHFPAITIHHSFLQSWHLPHRARLPFMPTAAESLPLNNYDVIISSGTFAKGIIVKPGTLHIHYCHTPPRFLWEESTDYIAHNVPLGAKTLASLIVHWLRIWDVHAASRVDTMIANSKWTQKKIKKIYQREAQIIYPFIDPIFFQKPKSRPHTDRDYMLIVSRLARYKHIDLAIQECNKLGISLVVIGKGPDRKRLECIAGPLTQFIGFVPDNELAGWYAGAKALILPGIEDFGLTPVEAMAQGAPVLAYRKGGAIETVIEHTTGNLFTTSKELRKLLTRMPKYKRKNIIAHAKQFSFECFKKEIIEAMEKARHAAVTTG